VPPLWAAASSGHASCHSAAGRPLVRRPSHSTRRPRRAGRPYLPASYNVNKFARLLREQAGGHGQAVRFRRRRRDSNLGAWDSTTPSRTAGGQSSRAALLFDLLSGRRRRTTTHVRALMSRPHTIIWPPTTDAIAGSSRGAAQRRQRVARARMSRRMEPDEPSARSTDACRAPAVAAALVAGPVRFEKGQSQRANSGEAKRKTRPVPSEPPAQLANTCHPRRRRPRRLRRRRPPTIVYLDSSIWAVANGPAASYLGEFKLQSVRPGLVAVVVVELAAAAPLTRPTNPTRRFDFGLPGAVPFIAAPYSSQRAT
jgi:hypothetical protein